MQTSSEGYNYINEISIVIFVVKFINNFSLNLRDISRYCERDKIEIFFFFLFFYFTSLLFAIWKFGPRNYAGFDICFVGSIRRTSRSDLPLASFRFATTLILGISDRKADLSDVCFLAARHPVGLFVTHRRFTVTRVAWCVHARGKARS